MKVGRRGLCLAPACWGRANACPLLGELCSVLPSAGQAAGEAVARTGWTGRTAACSRMAHIPTTGLATWSQVTERIHKL